MGGVSESQRVDSGHTLYDLLAKHDFFVCSSSFSLSRD